MLIMADDVQHLLEPNQLDENTDHATAADDQYCGNQKYIRALIVCYSLLVRYFLFRLLRSHDHFSPCCLYCSLSLLNIA